MYYSDTAIVKPVMRTLRLLLVTLLALVCCAFLDRIPEPPRALKPRILDRGLTVQIPVTRAVPPLNNRVRSRLASDSSPPFSLFASSLRSV